MKETGIKTVGDLYALELSALEIYLVAMVAVSISSPAASTTIRSNRTA